MLDAQVEIILVDDDFDDVEFTLRTFRKNNVSNPVLHMKDGIEALDFVFSTGKYSGRSSSNLLPLILLDLHMPKLSGIDVLKILKSKEETKHIPVIVFISSFDNPDTEECKKLGVDLFLTKPLVFERFIKEYEHWKQEH